MYSKWIKNIRANRCNAIYFLSDHTLLFQMLNKCRKIAEQMQNKCKAYQGPIESSLSIILIYLWSRSLLKMTIIRAKIYFTKGLRDDSSDFLRHDSDSSDFLRRNSDSLDFLRHDSDSLDFLRHNSDSLDFLRHNSDVIFSYARFFFLLSLKVKIVVSTCACNWDFSLQ